MAFKKTVRKYATKKNFKKGAKFAYKHRGTAQKALNLALKLKDMVNVEYKVYDKKINWTELGDGSNDPAVQDSIVFGSLFNPANGTGEGQRIGDSCKLQRLTGRGVISWLPDVAPPGSGTTMIRVILMRGKAEQGRTYPTTTTSGGNKAFLEELGVLGSKNEDTKYNTKTLYDKTYVLDVAKTNLIRFKWNFPLNWHINFEKGASTIQDAGLYLGVITNNGVNPHVGFYADFNVSYTDN